MINYYEILNINPDSGHTEIKLQYRKLAKKFHPDINKNNELATENFKTINTAYETLIDETSRIKYNVDYLNDFNKKKDFQKGFVFAEQCFFVFPKNQLLKNAFYDLGYNWILTQLSKNNQTGAYKILIKFTSSLHLTNLQKENLRSLLSSKNKAVEGANLNNNLTNKIIFKNKKSKFIHYFLKFLRNELVFLIIIINLLFNLTERIIYHLLNMILGLVDAIGIKFVTNIVCGIEKIIYFIVFKSLNLIQNLIIFLIKKIVYSLEARLIR